MKKAYKGFNINLECRKEKFEVGVVYEKTEKEQSKLRTCSSDGWHYCKTLKECFTWYKNDGKNRYCEIEILGNYKYDERGPKGITTKFKIIREISRDELLQLERDQLMSSLPLAFLARLQKVHPGFVGGSVALLLHGCKLNRLRSDKIDLDITLPHYSLLDKEKFNKKGNLEITDIDNCNGKSSGNDFNEVLLIDYKYKDLKSYNKEFIKVDVNIDPFQRYEIIEYKDVKYRVSPIENILEAKLKYAKGGSEKHKEDVRHLLGLNV